jgi:signal transduction histidine kinase
MPLILNVNDDETRRYILARMLRDGGFDVSEAASGEEALAVANAKRPDLILLDVKLPDVDGFEVCRRLKTDHATATTPVVMLSAVLVDPMHRVQGLDSGADGYLTDPLQPLVVMATIRALLRARAAEDARRESEAQYRTLFELNPLPSFVFDVETLRILAVNHAAVEHYGWTVEEFSGLLVTDLCPDGDAEQICAGRHLRKDGSRFDAETSETRTHYGGRDARLVVVVDVTERRLAEQRRRLRALSIGMLRAREEEARRIARELHDEAGQLLASVHIAVDRLAAEVPAVGEARVNEIKGLLDLTEAELRRIAHELRPTILDDLGLGPALAVLAENVSTRSGIPVTVNGRLELRLPAVVETAVYRIVQEALANAVRHAEASSIGVRLERLDGCLRTVVTDDGIGFDVNAVSARGDRGLGLIGIGERLEPLGGILEIDSTPRAGTRLIVTIPLVTDTDADRSR